MAGQRIELPAYSMWVTTPVYEVGGNIVFGLLSDPVVLDPTDQLFTVPASGYPRLDLISADFYGAPDLWWVIALVNNVLDPLAGIPTGTQIRIPTKERLASLGVLNV